MTKAELYQACMLPLFARCVYHPGQKRYHHLYRQSQAFAHPGEPVFPRGVPHDNKVSQMIAHAYAFDVIVCQSEFEALVEASQIKAHTPSTISC